MKTKIAIFDLTGCQGCEFHLLALDELLLDFFQDFEITNWRLLKEKNDADFDIAFIEGAVTTQEHIKLLKQIRETSKIVVALGACAISGNIFAQLDPEMRKQLAPKIYDKDYKLKAEFLEPVEKFIKVDERIPGCPPDLDKFKELLPKLKGIESKIKTVSPPDYTAKIEGHGELSVDFKNKTAKFTIQESERLVEGLLLNKPYIQAPFIVSRICGICPTAHNLCSLTALEDAFKIQPPQSTIILRQLLACGQMIKSHLLHLFFLVLPDYANTRGSIELAKQYPAEFHLMLNIKRIADNILKVIGGTSSFPSNTGLGGFKKPPTLNQLQAIKTEIFEVIDEAQDLITLFSQLPHPEIEVETNLECTKRNGYPYYPGTYNKLTEVVQKDSPAKLGFSSKGEIIKVGAMARLSHYPDQLNPKAKQQFNTLKPNLLNPYINNLAQAIEILHFLEQAIILIDELDEKSLKQAIEITPKTTTGQGKAFIEAPRGILHHQLKIKKGIIQDYNIIPPTQINLASLELEANEVIKKSANADKARNDIEKLIRAFDPCITCAVH